MTDDKLIKVLSGAGLVLTLSLGSAVLWAYQSEAQAQALTKTLKITQDSQRSAWQKVYDMQEGQNDRVDAAEGKAQLLQWELDQCKASHEHH